MNKEYNINLNLYHIFFIILLLLLLLFYKKYENFSEQNVLNINNTFNSDTLDVKNNVFCNNINITKFKGIIVAWSGTIDTIPSGWVLCDGQTYNGITPPDLRSRFVLGASAKDTTSLGNNLTPKQVTNTDGAETVTLNLNNISNHTHNIDTSLIGCDGNECQGGKPPLGYPFIFTKLLTGNKLVASTTDPSAELPRTTNSNYTTKPHNNMPPYYALAFIMKI